MDKKHSFELKRKFIHIISILLVLAYFYLSQTYTKIIAMSPILFFLLVALILEYLRIKKVKLPLYPIFFRKKESNKLGGHIYYLIGMALVLYFFDFNIALASILMLIIGDTVAAFVGIRFGKRKIRKDLSTTWEGTTAEFITDLIIGLILLPYLIAIPMALVATIVESFAKKIDDNLTVPVLSSLTGHILRILLK